MLHTLLSTITESLFLSSATFLLMSAVIAYAGTKLSYYADRIADSTGLGEALIGGVLLGACTSLSGTITSVTAAYDGFADLAVSNGIGGIAAQTAFLAIADMSYRKANLEHGAASLANLLFASLLMLLLSLVLASIFSPEISFLGVHPISVILILAYLAYLRVIRLAKTTPMWSPIVTRETIEDIPDKEETKRNQSALWIAFAITALVVAVAGFFIAKTGITIATKTGLSETFVGTFFTAVSTSLPELVVSVAAVRQKALVLAVSNIIGGNTFDVLFLSLSDFAYRDGSIYHAISDQPIFVIILAMLMTSILSLGLLFREKHGPAKIGWESVLLLLVFIAGFFVLLQ